MKFKIIEHKRTALEPELAAIPYVLTDEEQKTVEGGHHCNCYGNADSCGNRNNSCSPYICEVRRTSCGNRTWIREEFSQE